VDTDDDAAALVAFVRTRDAACPVCSYNLRGLAAPVCPECSAHLHLQVGSENLRLGPWLVGVVSLALGLGFDGVVSLIMIGALIIVPPPPSPAAWRQVLTILGVLVLLAAICGCGLWGMLRWRGVWTRMPLPKQRMVAASLFLGTGLVHAAAGAHLMGWW
jgi:hypothetical protein